MGVLPVPAVAGFWLRTVHAGCMHRVVHASARMWRERRADHICSIHSKLQVWKVVLRLLRQVYAAVLFDGILFLALLCPICIAASCRLSSRSPTCRPTGHQIKVKHNEPGSKWCLCAV